MSSNGIDYPHGDSALSASHNLWTIPTDIFRPQATKCSCVAASGTPNTDRNWFMDRYLAFNLQIQHEAPMILLEELSLAYPILPV